MKILSSKLQTSPVVVNLVMHVGETHAHAEGFTLSYRLKKQKRKILFLINILVLFFVSSCYLSIQESAES